MPSIKTWRMHAASFARRHRDTALLLAHAGLFALAFFGAFGLSYNFRQFGDWFVPCFLPMLPFVVGLKIAVFGLVGQYRNSWRYVGIRDLLAVVFASWVSTFIFVVLYYITINLGLRLHGVMLFTQFPTSVFLLDFGTTIAAVGAARVAVRLYFEEMRPVASGGPVPCLILGAGDTGESLLREILRMNTEYYRVVGFLDDDPSKQNIRIHGVPVLGTLDQVRRVAEVHEADHLLVALPRVAHKRLRRVVELCQGTNLRFRTIPAIADVIGGRVTVSQFRDIGIHDLLGREQVQLDEAEIRQKIEGQRVLVTGAGGSIGAEICRQVARFRPARLVLVERAENNLFEIDGELARLAPALDRACYVADITDPPRIDAILRAEKPHLLFHAAAHKHVPMMEANVGEAIKNNVHGTRVVADAARTHAVRRFVMISTDKAVNPTSVMGATKRVAEMYIQQLGDGATTEFMTVRFGNVLGSSGSVVPIFRQQIAAGGPVTITDPRMTRYFMTIPEASQLVLQAGVMGAHGDIFVLDMGEPVRILDLAKEMITLSGFRPGEDIEIVFTGIRPGEKLFEELNIHGEDVSPTRHAQIGIWKTRPGDWDRVRAGIDRLLEAVDRASDRQLKEALADLVPEFRPVNADAAAAPPGESARVVRYEPALHDSDSVAGVTAPLGTRPT